MTEKNKPKTRWSCLITIVIVVLILGGGSYLFYAYLYPVISKQLNSVPTYTPPELNKEGKDKVKAVKSYGEPIKENEQAGRADPFAPI
ncbi:hypothetical protein KJ713_01890 [Patescibacteria group bacterium]|nr:hypothetical protein [Patescibacteria group bacterium]